MNVGSFREDFPVDYAAQKPFARVLPRGFRCPEYESFFQEMNGATFGAGLYRIMNAREIVLWNDIARSWYDFAPGRLVECFGYDWLGRLFALDSTRVDGSSLTIMLEPGSGDIYKIPAGLAQFHRQLDDKEFAQGALATDFWRDWQQEQRSVPLPRNRCAGYSVPLFLGGTDTVGNLETIDMEVYWQLLAQMRRQIDVLPEGTKIASVSLVSKLRD